MSLRKLVPIPAAALLLAAPAAARAGTLTLKHGASVYLDEKEAALKAPEGVACAESGLVVVADTGNGRLVKYASDAEGRITGGAELKVDQVTAPVRVQIDKDGNVLALDWRTRRIARFEKGGKYTGSVEVQKTVRPASFKLDAAGNLYVLDVGAKKIVVAEPTGVVTRELPIPADARVVTDIAVDGAGTVYALEATKAIVWAAEKSATELKPLTKSLKSYMSFPAYLHADRGVLLVVDQNGSGIVQVGIDGSYQGRQLAMGWVDGAVYYPSQICMRENGQLFVADRSNNRVQMFLSIK